MESLNAKKQIPVRNRIDRYFHCLLKPSDNQKVNKRT